MEKIDKMLELLDKSSLTDEERKFISDVQNEDSEARKLILVYKSLENSLEDKLHLDPALLADAVLIETGGEPADIVTGYIYPKIKEHIEVCETCRNEYDLLMSEYKDAEIHVAGSLNKPQEKINTKGGIFSFRNVPQVKYAFAAVFSLFIIYFGLYAFSSFITPAYKQNVINDDTQDMFITRGRTSVLFQKSLDAMNRNESGEAINYLEQDIKENSGDRSIFYSYYILGILQLENAQDGFIGLFKSYDTEKVKRAITSFEKSISLNNTGDYKNVELDAQYYLGRAYLLTDDFSSAEKHFKIVIENKGRYSAQAETLLKNAAGK